MLFHVLMLRYSIPYIVILCYIKFYYYNVFCTAVYSAFVAGTNGVGRVSIPRRFSFSRSICNSSCSAASASCAELWPRVPSLEGRVTSSEGWEPMGDSG